jgi:hypothetical protein
MRTKHSTMPSVLRTIVLTAGVLGLFAAMAAAQTTRTVRLFAAATTKLVTLPNGTQLAVPVWGFGLQAEDLNANGVLDPGEDLNENGLLDPAQGPMVPGPRLTIPAGVTTLEVHLDNMLSEPTSVVIPGQAFQATPVRRDDGRIVSMTVEAPPLGTATYQFNNLKPGTFLYQSGSHPAVQVQMGLYGAMTMNAGAGEAYAGDPYDHEVLLLYSEIDMALHDAVASGTYGHPEVGGPTSTIDYKPTLFLVNGDSYANDNTPGIEAGSAGQRTLIRLLNAGLRSHVPVIENGVMTMIAEDGNRAPWSQTHAAVLLAAGKTHDVIWIPASGGTFPIYDRMLSLNAEGEGDAGMLAKLRVTSTGGPTGSVSGLPDQFTATEDLTFNIPNLVGGVSNIAGGVLGNDTGAVRAVLVTGPRSAEAFSLRVNGTFNYRGRDNFFGVDSFTYRAVGPGPAFETSEPITVTLVVNGVSDRPRALAQEVGGDARTSIPVILDGTDADGDPVIFYITRLPLPLASRGTLSYIDPVTNIEHVLTSADFGTATTPGTPIPGGRLIFTPNPGVPPALPFSGEATIAFRVWDGTDPVVDPLVNISTAALVTVTVHPLELTEELTGNPLAINVVGSDGAPVAEFKWTVEEDRTHEVIPGNADPFTLAVSFHRSYMPVRQVGDETTTPLVDPTRRYFVSVLPKSGGYSVGGARVARDQSSVTVVVNKGPIPTAQVRVRVFHDNAPLNGVWDTGEPGLGGFEVTVEDAGGRYGMSGGHAMFDAFGNQIGTVYAPCPPEQAPCDGLQVATFGQGFVLTDADGYALIRNLPPGKYGIKVRAPGGPPWQQTSTIEGTRVIDAWVKANEPQYFTEFGPPGPHADVGFVQQTRDATVLGAGVGPFATVSGRVTNLHMSRPPAMQFFSGAPYDFTRPWVALNTGVVGGTLIYAGPTNEDGSFSISGVPSGSYQLWIFDSALDIIIASRVINVSAPTNLALGDLPVFHWFTRLYHYVFEDEDEDGFKDEGEMGLPEQAINLRWRDGSMYQSSATDMSGFVPFEEVFPFFAWQIAEVDYARMKATGVTVVVDNGGDPNVNTLWASQVGAEADAAVLTPQPQAENGGAAWRTESGPVLLQAFQGFIGQTSVMLWGKAPYAPTGSIVTDVNVAPFDAFPTCTTDSAGVQHCDTDGNGNGIFDVDQYHGGVSGIVHYSTTRAENDPRWGTGEPWEPGIPGIRVQLWDITRTRLLNEVTTDSWDDSQPSNCQGDVFTYLGQPKDCYDGMRNWNQVRPGVFDGGYAFYTMLEPVTDATTGALVPVADRTIEKPLPAGRYVVKVLPPAGYTLVKEEDKNVDFGEEYIPQEFYLTGYPLADAGGPGEAQPGVTVEEYPLPAPFCVGALHLVPETLSLFPGAVNATYGGDKRPLCDAKLIAVRDGMNAAANFFLFTDAPIAGHIVGFVLDDTTNEFDPNSPQFGEKYAPPFMPVAIHDWAGREITRTFTDQFGRYNVLVPSTFSANLPEPSGMSPNMLTACINSPVLADGSPDPHFHKQYSHFCYTFQYMPGTTTYLDTPVLPTGAFTGSDAFPVDAELPNSTPVVAQATGLYYPSGLTYIPRQVGPYIVDRGSGGPLTINGRLRTIQITSAGDVQVPNPMYDGAAGTQEKLVTRDYGFGAPTSNGIVRLGGQPIQVTSWSNSVIQAVVPTGVRTGELTIERCTSGSKLLTALSCPGESRRSVLGVTLTVATGTWHALRPPIVPSAGQTIQAAIDAAAPGDLILVPPRTYNEMVVMSKPVRLQGWGAMQTTINTVQVPAETIQAWRDRVGNLLSGTPDFLLADQLNILGPAPYLEGAIRAATGGEGAGVTVFARNQARLPAVPLLGIPDGACIALLGFQLNQAYCLMNETLGVGSAAVWRPNARIDGFSIIGSSQDAGVFANGNARFLEISNNRIYNNYGFLAGGIRIGHPNAILPLADEDARNGDVTIHHNAITQNAGFDAGGGVVLGTGSARYRVADNWVAANFSGGWGAGITHLGLSQGGVIDNNVVIFNETFNQGVPTSGGGIFVGGRSPVAGAMTPGAGNVAITNNLVLGNQAGGGDGGGIALHGVNGADALQPAELRHRVGLYNNMVVNNVAGLAGGGLSLQDAAYVEIVHNTVANNDSLATAGAAFLSPTTSTPQPAGIVSRGHTPLLAQALGSGEPAFSQPTLANTTVWHNRSFYFGPLTGGVIPPGGAATQLGLIENPTREFWDLEVLGAPAGSMLDPQYSVLTDTTGYAATNVNTAPDFMASYFNGSRNPTIIEPDGTPGIIVPAAFDEGGNFIRPQFGPLSLTDNLNAFFGNYHVATGVVGGNLNVLYPVFVPAALQTDFDAQPRSLVAPHIGADQSVPSLPGVVTPMP